MEEVVLKGTFVSYTHPTMGTATVNMEGTVLTFTDFKTDPGPKLLISTEFVDLGDVKGIEGNYAYTIPDDTDLSKCKFVSVWCVDFLVSFGHAELK